ncbi:hypothetical protein TNCT_584271 [Trichonephila clavata]|uniref:Uncharacterized protein n=1 Tax=Trichonephila clavata TaxID=2740835 RepID=A0A8X6GTW2_TRICU|nr:hypothetical protein TNCT_584271 [Trichonephila clavata]
MRSHFKFLFCNGHGCSCCTKQLRWRQKEKSEKVQQGAIFKPRKKECRHSHLPYIETHPENEKVFTFFMKALSRSTITGVNRLASATNM